MKKMLMTLLMCLMMAFAVPAAPSYASNVQTETVAAQPVAETENNEEESFMLIMMMGGGLLIILFAVITAMSTFAGAVAVAANMDVDGE